MGGFLTNKRCVEVLGTGDHGTTFGGNPVSAAAALEVLSQVTDLLPKVAEKGLYIKQEIEGWKLPTLGRVRGRGLMLGVPISGFTPKEIAQLCVKNGLLILTAGTDTLRILPPLNISYDELDKGLSILKSVLAD